MRSRQKISAVVLVLLLGAVVYGLIRTTEPQAVPSSQDNGKHGVPSRAPLVDQSPLKTARSEEHTSELQSLAYLVCRLLLEKKKQKSIRQTTRCDPAV